jgi:archaemetzincin
MCQLLEPPPAPAERRIGIATVDLFLPVFTHVFGTAQLGGNVGVASLYRLRPEYAGAPQDIGRMRERLAKEVLHELGHTFRSRPLPSALVRDGGLAVAGGNRSQEPPVL